MKETYLEALPGKVKRFFPTSNSTKGLYSLLGQVRTPDARRVYIIKGAAGSGKSWFMGEIAREVARAGYIVELMHCSSNVDGLDAVCFPQLGASIVYGSEPHPLEPSYPGILDEVLHFGAFWDCRKLDRARGEIIELYGRIRCYFDLARHELNESKAIFHQLEVYNGQAMDFRKVDQATVQIIEQVFKQGASSVAGEGRRPWARHFFASAVTPDGPVNFIETLLQNIQWVYILTGGPGTGKSTILQTIARSGLRRGWRADVFHCGLDPDKVELVVFPELGGALLNGSPPHWVICDEQVGAPKSKEITRIDLSSFQVSSRVAAYCSQREEAEHRLWMALQRAVEHLRYAEWGYDELQKIYDEATDFSALGRLREEVTASILSLSTEQPGAGMHFEYLRGSPMELY